jgi:ribosomal protein S18 acetylase RimI-like enzyme
MQFIIRDYRPEDFDTLWRIDQQCFAAGISYSRLELALYMRRVGSFTLVAESMANNGDESVPSESAQTAPASRIVGFITAEERRLGGHIITIDVLAHARRFGIGSALLQSAETRLRAAGCQSVLLETAVDNRAALAFYKRHRYFLAKTLPRYYTNGMDALVMKKELPAAAEAR